MDKTDYKLICDIAKRSIGLYNHIQKFSDNKNKSTLYDVFKSFLLDSRFVLTFESNIHHLTYIYYISSIESVMEYLLFLSYNEKEGHYELKICPNNTVKMITYKFYD